MLTGLLEAHTENEGDLAVVYVPLEGAEVDVRVGHRAVVHPDEGPRVEVVDDSAVDVDSTGCLLYTSPSPRD